MTMTSTRTRGSVAAAWIEANLVHAEGDYYGRPFHLHPFQRDFLDRLNRTDQAGRREVRRAVMGLAKGNGKTELAAAIGVAELAGPFAPTSPLVIIAAASFEQADILFGAARTMISEGPLAPYFEVYDTEILRRDGKPGVMRRVAAASGTNDGARPTAVIADELHEWVGNKERVHLILSNGLAKREDTLELSISTAGASTDSLLGRLWTYGQRVNRGEVEDPAFAFEWRSAAEHWDLSNPDELRAAIREANPAIEAGFLNEDRLVARFGEIPTWEFERYILNRWVSSGTAWIADDAWNACAAPSRQVVDSTKVALGWDGSNTRDNSALWGATVEDRPHLFRVGLWERDPRDSDWVVPRDEVDARLAEAFERFDVVSMACDRSGWYGEVDAWAKEYGETIVLKVPQTPQDMAPAADKFRAAVLERKLTHDGDLALSRAVANAVTRDTRYGQSIKKEHPGSPRKIDAAIAAVLAFDRASNAPKPRRPRRMVSY